jgi:hypothetical protein
MPKREATTRHNIYLADSVWDALRQRAIVERSSASRIIAHLLQDFVRYPARLPQGRYKARMAEEALDDAKGRTVRLPAGLMNKVQAALAGRTSLASLIDDLLRQYLMVELSAAGAAQAEPPAQPPQAGSTSGSGYRYEPVPRRIIQIRDMEFDLGENPFTIHLGQKKNEEE